MSGEQDKVKRPASQYYWGDWWKDKGLHSCCLTARGLWHEMNCLMHEGDPYGHLTLNDKLMTVAQLANQCRITAGKCKALLDELEAAGVFSRTSEGVIFSRRMVRDERIREARAAGGKAGAEHGVKGAEAGKKGGRPAHADGGSETPLSGGEKPPPSSSSSSSSSPSRKKRGAKAPLSANLPTWMQALIDLWHEVLPELPGVEVINAERQQVAKDFRDWVLTTRRADGTQRATNDDEFLAWTRNYFGRARHNDFIMGRGHRSPEHKGWRCSFEFLLSARGMQKVIEQTEAPE